MLKPNPNGLNLTAHWAITDATRTWAPTQPNPKLQGFHKTRHRASESPIPDGGGTTVERSQGHRHLLHRLPRPPWPRRHFRRGKLFPFLFHFLLFGCPEAAGTGKIIETLYWLCYCDHFMKIGWLHLLVWYAMQRCGAYNGFGSESNFIFVFQARWVWFNSWIASLILYWFQDA